MNPQINAITVAARDIKLLRKFYHEVLGWTILTENDSVVMYKLNQTVLTLCSYDVFTEYTGAHPEDGSNKGFYFTINLDSPKQVDDNFKKLMAMNVRVIKMPKKVFWGGYSGFFADPEANQWEVCYNPISRTKI